tara:strand:+ start:32 stop:823 length:792 start_codon:yes stop_codon:yes gene_type:complete
MSTKCGFFEIIVVDNNSNDGSIEFIRYQYPEVKLIINLRNDGYTKAINKALRSSKGRYKVVLNPDTELMPNAIDIMINHMKSSKSIGIVGPKVLNIDGSFQKSCRRGVASPGAVFSYFLGLSEKYPKNKKFTGYHLNHLDENIIHEVSGVSGSCMLINNNLINEIGYFDERYFAYQEDSDYCLTAINNGWNIYYNPDAVVVHHGGRGGAHYLPFKANFEWHRSYFRYYDKHFAKNYSIFFNLFYYSMMLGKLIFAQTRLFIKS